jgi:hypothetical protein
MAQLDPDRYRKLSINARYGTSDGLYYDADNNTLVLALGDTVVDVITATGSTADLEVTSEARGDILRRGASAWERHSAKTSGQILVGDGADIASVAVSGDATLASTGALTIAANAVEASMLGANLGKGHLPLDITMLRIIAADAIGNVSEGMLLDGNTAPTLARVNGATDKALRVAWAAASVVECQFPPVALPGDLDDAAAVTLHFLIAKGTNTDTAAVIDVQAFQGVGDTEMGGNTAALGSAALGEYIVTLAAGDIAAHPSFLNVSLVPGAHANDAIYLYAAWVEYTRKS